MSYLLLDKLFQNTLFIAVALKILKISKSSKFSNVFTILRLFKSFLKK